MCGLLLGVGGLVTNQPSGRGHAAGGWSPTVTDDQFWGELMAAAGEISCPSAGKNLSATGEDLMSADSLRDISTVRAHCPAPSIESRLKEVEQNENSGPTVPNYDRLATHGKEFKRLRCH